MWLTGAAAAFACGGDDRDFGKGGEGAQAGVGQGGDDAAPAVGGEPSEPSEGGSISGGMTGTAGALEASAGIGGAPQSPECMGDDEACGDLCVDTAVDTLNCGACGHDCLGGECVLGTCQPFEFAIVNGIPSAFAQDDDFIYWGGGYGALGKRVRDGSASAIELVAENASEVVQRLQVAGSTLFWATDSTNNGVRGCPLPSCAGGPKTLIAGAVPSRGIAFDAQTSTLYWGDAKTVRQKKLPSGAATTLTTVTDDVQLIATDGVYVYVSDWNSGTRKGHVHRVALGGGQPVTLVGAVDYVTGLIPFGNTLYVLDSLGTDKAARVLAVPLPNGVGANEAPSLASTSDSYGLAVDESGAYWVTKGSQGSVSRCELTGCDGVPEVLATTSHAFGIATDATGIYWGSGGKIMKLAK